MNKFIIPLLATLVMLISAPTALSGQRIIENLWMTPEQIRAARANNAAYDRQIQEQKQIQMNKLLRSIISLAQLVNPVYPGSLKIFPYKGSKKAVYLTWENPGTGNVWPDASEYLPFVEVWAHTICPHGEINGQHLVDLIIVEWILEKKLKK